MPNCTYRVAIISSCSMHFLMRFLVRLDEHMIFVSQNFSHVFVNLRRLINSSVNTENTWVYTWLPTYLSTKALLFELSGPSRHAIECTSVCASGNSAKHNTRCCTSASITRACRSRTTRGCFAFLVKVRKTALCRERLHWQSNAVDS